MKKIIMPRNIHELLLPEQSFLSRGSVQIITADTNSQALAIHRAEVADLIIAYLDTEQMSGEDLCSQIRSDAGMRGVSILLICGQDETEISRCINCNANAYVTTPIVPALLLQEAHRLLHIPPRNTCRIPVNIRMECTTRGKHFTGMIENLSTAGLFFRSAALLPEGAIVHCTFAAAGSRKLTISGEVVRILSEEPEAGYGVSFFDISTEAAAAISRLSEQDNC